MSNLDANSTRDEVLAAYANNASYREDNSPAKAAAFITACTLLLSPAMSFKRSRGGNQQEIELDLTLYQKQLDAAVSWSEARQESTAAASVTHLSIANFRR